MKAEAFKEIRKQAEIALCDMEDIVEYGSIGLEEDLETLVGIRSRLKHILILADDALKEEV